MLERRDRVRVPDVPLAAQPVGVLAADVERVPVDRRVAERVATLDLLSTLRRSGPPYRMSPGKLADVVVLSRYILTVPEDEILGTEVVYTIVGWRVMYRRE